MTIPQIARIPSGRGQGGVRRNVARMVGAERQKNPDARPDRGPPAQPAGFSCPQAILTVVLPCVVIEFVNRRID
jgi:hypothetical protein